ncbi:MAG: hypothetical protein ACJ8KX_14135 [Chthoniobacterales bacterium]
MKKLIVVIILAAAVAFAAWLGMRSGSPKISSTTVTALLPRETVGFVHVPDVREARAQWHNSELDKLWREPAVQAFLQKPLAQNDAAGATSQKLQQLDQLGMRDAFLAMLPAGEDQMKFVGGFRFDGKTEDAERIIGEWRSAQTNAPHAQHQTVSYQQHQIDVATEGAITVASVYDRDWFFAANDVPALQALLDRADGRVKDSASTLGADDNFVTAFRHMPRRYVTFGYARLDRYFDKLASITEEKSLRARVEFLRKVRCAAGAIAFEDSRMRDVLFVAMPKIPDQGELTRSSLAMTSSDSFLYAATFLDFPDTPPAGGAAATGFLPGLSASGISAAEWKSAFGPELGVIGDWTANARFPGVLLTLPVKDAAKARQLVRAVTVYAGADKDWTASEKGGVDYFTQPPSSPMLPMAATVAVSDQLLVAGLDRAAVESAITRKPEGSPMASSPLFKTAERLVPTAKNAFIFLDTALLYTRLDAAIRPMLVMAAAFMPVAVDTIDVGKIPPAEVVTKHLSPLVLSQTYSTDGYVTESAGPVSIVEAAAGAIIAASEGRNFYQHQFSGQTTGRPGAAPAASPTGSPSPTP